MPRLNDHAYELLSAEVQRLINGPLEEVRRDIALRRLNKFRLQEGDPVTYAELKAAVEDIFPEFDDAILKRAARINQGAGRLGLIRNIAIGTAAVVGGLWFLNLPYPMIRMPVSRVAPIVLLPSFMSMDHSYRQATSLVEQADQLVNQATSAEDIELGAERVQQSQRHLDRLPVWFLGYYPRAYCTLFGCTWRFTYDEFQTARKAVGRMEAKVFQEDNALEALESGTAAVEAAKQQYQSAATAQAQSAAATAWQTGVDALAEIPAATLAGRIAQTRLGAFQRDLGQAAVALSGGSRASTLIEAAQGFAWTASEEVQNPPYPAETWQRVVGLWQTAIDRLEQVPVEDVGYAEAQRMLAEYKNKLGAVEQRLAQEMRAQDAFESAQQQSTELTAQVDRLSTAEYTSRLQGILNDLGRVESGTMPFESAQRLEGEVRSRLQQVAN